MPPTGAGLIRYFQEETHGPKLSPKVVMGFAISIIVIEILLRFYGQSLLGF
jgi:preprotein translocase subunit Sec61beta